MSGETGTSISNADMRKIKRIISQETGNSISNADKKMVQALIGRREPKGGMARKKITPFETGGEVPSKLKGFSKLPEPVQQKMNPSLAKKYEQGGEVK